MCAGIQNPSSPAYACDCHLQRDEEEYDALDEYFDRADYEYERALDDELDALQDEEVDW